jgi:hypothetical protein
MMERAQAAAIAQVRKLLALATSDNPHEATLAWRKAGEKLST